MNDMTLFLDLILMASGAYCMYTFLRLAVTKRLFKNGLLVPKEKKISDCADEQMYIGYMMPPLAVMAVMTMGYGVCMGGIWTVFPSVVAYLYGKKQFPHVYKYISLFVAAEVPRLRRCRALPQPHGQLQHGIYGDGHPVAGGFCRDVDHPGT